MKTEKWKIIVYWIATVLTAGNFAFGGVMYISRNPEVVAGLAQLGYPAYIASILGFWKLGSAIALMIPRFPLLKEWAYAGLVFNLTGASASNAFSGQPIGHIIAPLIVLAIAGVSYWLRSPDRRVAEIGR